MNKYFIALIVISATKEKNKITYFVYLVINAMIDHNIVKFIVLNVEYAMKKMMKIIYKNH